MVPFPQFMLDRVRNTNCSHFHQRGGGWKSCIVPFPQFMMHCELLPTPSVPLTASRGEGGGGNYLSLSINLAAQ